MKRREVDSRVRVSPDTHRRLRIVAAYTGVTIEKTLKRMATEEINRLYGLMSKTGQKAQDEKEK